MTTPIYRTDAELQRQALRILSRELGATHFIRFLQYYEQGQGDYTQERDQWQSEYTVDSLAGAITAWKTGPGNAAE
jgi:hypothetical protein